MGSWKMIVVEEECHLEGVEDLHEQPRECLLILCQGLCVCGFCFPLWLLQIEIQLFCVFHIKYSKS